MKLGKIKIELNIFSLFGYHFLFFYIIFRFNYFHLVFISKSQGPVEARTISHPSVSANSEPHLVIGRRLALAVLQQCASYGQKFSVQNRTGSIQNTKTSIFLTKISIIV